MAQKLASFSQATREVAESSVNCFTAFSRVDEAMTCKLKCMIKAVILLVEAFCCRSNSVSSQILGHVESPVGCYSPSPLGMGNYFVRLARL